MPRYGNYGGPVTKDLPKCEIKARKSSENIFLILSVYVIQRKVTLIMLGLDNAGKTATVKGIQGGEFDLYFKLIIHSFSFLKKGLKGAYFKADNCIRSSKTGYLFGFILLG